jgi:N6-adenosine-specific RNA methylase IME4
MIPPLLKGLRRRHYACVLCDPPWRFTTRSARGITSRSPEHQYATMTLAQIEALPVRDYAADNAWLWLWVTMPMLAVGAHIPIMRAWGFEPSTIALTWCKVNPPRDKQGVMFLDHKMFFVGLGYTTRGNAEVVVLGRRGSPKRLSKAVRQVIFQPRREHSRKPDEAHERIEQFCAGPRLELFARQRRLGWICRGDQSDKFMTGDADASVRLRANPRNAKAHEGKRRHGDAQLQPPDRPPGGAVSGPARDPDGLGARPRPARARRSKAVAGSRRRDRKPRAVSKGGPRSGPGRAPA